jgi:hypothetical protein
MVRLLRHSHVAKVKFPPVDQLYDPRLYERDKVVLENGKRLVLWPHRLELAGRYGMVHLLHYCDDC